MHTLLLALVAAGNPFAGVKDTFISLGTEAAAVAVALVPIGATLAIDWQLLSGMFNNPSVQRFKKLLAGALGTVLIAGMTPGLVSFSYGLGGEIGDSLKAGVPSGPASPQPGPTTPAPAAPVLAAGTGQ